MLEALQGSDQCCSTRRSTCNWLLRCTPIYIYVYNRVYTCILYMRTHIHIIHLYTYLLACQVCQVCFLCSQVRYDSRQKHHSVFISTSVAPHPQFDTRTSLFEVRILGEPEAVQAARRRFFDTTVDTVPHTVFFCNL